jgi:hypothetical protein
MKTGLSKLVCALPLAAAVSQAIADDTVELLCLFEHGTIEVAVNYTKGTANGDTAMITDNEIVWKPSGEGRGLAVVNRYTGVMQISRGRKEFTGMCNRLIRE